MRSLLYGLLLASGVVAAQDVYKCVDDQGRVRDITSSDVNNYLRSAMGHTFTAKDFRTWAGTILAARALDDLSRTAARGPSEKHVVQAVEAVSQLLNNTRSVCRKCYVHPMIVEAYLDGSLEKTLHGKAARRGARISGLSAFENAVVALLRQRTKVEARRAA